MPRPTRKAASHLAALREQVPPRPLSPREVRRVLDRQATRLLQLCKVARPPVPIFEIAESLPHVEVRVAYDLPTSGRADWNGVDWVILVDGREPRVRQRYSVAHELAHIIWHPVAATALPDFHSLLHAARAEQAADYFGGVLLMPRTWMKRAYFEDGIRDLPSLARQFDVSTIAMKIRLEQLGYESWPEQGTPDEEVA